MNIKPLAALSCLYLIGCASLHSSAPTAVAKLAPTAGNKTTGAVTFIQRGDKVHVEGNIAGLAPGQHGFHVHEKGDCSAPDATSAGSHFNPSSKQHGNIAGGERHGGDLGNLTADSNGNATINVDIEGVSAKPGEANSVVGRGLIVHADPDDFKTQPTGNSGKRLACAVVTAK
ncbi:MAG: superoxide dismutase family protein [Pseudomonadota bacterium]